MLEQEVWLEKTPYLITGIEQLFYISYFIYIYLISGVYWSVLYNLHSEIMAHRIYSPFDWNQDKTPNLVN